MHSLWTPALMGWRCQLPLWSSPAPTSLMQKVWGAAMAKTWLGLEWMRPWCSLQPTTRLMCLGSSPLQARRGVQARYLMESWRSCSPSSKSISQRWLQLAMRLPTALKCWEMRGGKQQTWQTYSCQTGRMWRSPLETQLHHSVDCCMWSAVSTAQAASTECREAIAKSRRMY